MASDNTTIIWRVRLVHSELGTRVVEVSGEQGGQILTMALGEATTAEVAEDRARRRAAQVLLETHPTTAPPVSGGNVRQAEEGDPGQSSAPDPQSFPSPPSTISPTTTPPLSPQPSPSQVVSEPADWSEDLAVVEAQLVRLGWDRNQESVYLERCFGQMERSAITRYQDLRLYIAALQALSPPADPCTAPLLEQPQQQLPEREVLMQNNNALLAQLGWNTEQGRAFLENHFGHSSRQFLSNEQLMRFNQRLEAHLVAP